MRADAGSEAFRAEAKAFIQKMVADLPADGRDFAGKDEAGLELLPRPGACQRHRPGHGAPQGRWLAMRLRRLDLIRYGKFTDRTIDFGPKPGVGPDLHIVFGLNEAGKSTALSAYLDLLFGIEERSRYNFLHEYSAMRIGGVLELGGAEHAFTRTKQRNNSLLERHGPAGKRGGDHGTSRWPVA